jgi:hypothetical protein
MKKILAIQISVFVIISSSLIGMFAYTDVYEDVQSGIVSVLCLSCLKLQPKTKTDFIFEIAYGESHPNFVLENLTHGVVFLHYSEDACYGCDIMYPIIQDLFDITFGKEDMVYKVLKFKDSNISYFYINIDHTSKEMEESFPIYDKDQISGLPMFAIITLGYDKGIVRPYYTTVYGTLGLDNNDDRFLFLNELMSESIDIYNQNSEGYLPEL